MWLAAWALLGAAMPPVASTQDEPQAARRHVEAMRGTSMRLGRHSDPQRDTQRERIRRALRPLRDDAVRALAEALGDRDPQMRRNAALMLWQLGSPLRIDDLDPIETTAARDALVEALRDDDRDVRAWAALALGPMGGGAASARPALIAALGDGWEGVRGNACLALAAIAPMDVTVRDALEALRSDPSAQVRACAAYRPAADEELGDRTPCTHLEAAPRCS